MQKCILRWFQKHLTLYNFLFWYQSWWSYRTGPAVYKSDASKNVLELYCLHFSNYILYGVLLVNLTEIASKDTVEINLSKQKSSEFGKAVQ